MDIIENIFIFLVGLAISLPIGRRMSLSLTKISIYYVYHGVFCIFYYIFTFSSPTDAQQYYDYSFSLLEPFNVGTAGIYYLTNFFSTVIGLSYLNTFLVYNIFGFIGVLAFSAALQEITLNKSTMARRLAMLLPLLPGVSFWSAMIGKDALQFLGTGLLCWSIIDLRKRSAPMIVGLLLILFVRPHIAAMLLASMAGALIISGNIRMSRKILLTFLSIPVALGVAYFSATYLGLTDFSAVAINDYVDDRQSANMEGGSSIDIKEMSAPMRMFSYLFRPLFVDTSGFMGYIVSLENVLLLVLFLIGFVNIARFKSSLSRYSQTAFTLYVLVCWVLLANTTANLGLADRQKWMFVPVLLCLIVGRWSSGRTSCETSALIPRYAAG